jgi:hypothetical protein
MIKFRPILLGTLAGCMVLAAGCKSLAGSACLKAPPEAEVQNRPPLRIPVGLDAVATDTALKVPALESTTVLPVTGRCLEDPPLIQPLPDPVASEKAQKRNARKASREARDARPPGPRFTGN